MYYSLFTLRPTHRTSVHTQYEQVHTSTHSFGLQPWKKYEYINKLEPLCGWFPWFFILLYISLSVDLLLLFLILYRSIYLTPETLWTWWDVLKQIRSYDGSSLVILDQNWTWTQQPGVTGAVLLPQWLNLICSFINVIFWLNRRCFQENSLQINNVCPEMDGSTRCNLSCILLSYL